MSPRLERLPRARTHVVITAFRRPFAQVDASGYGRSAEPAAIASLLALAHHLQTAIDEGIVADRSTIAGVLGMTTARVSQVMNLLLLAPDIQEELLGLTALDGVEPISEKQLREVARERGWSGQRARWAALTSDSRPRRRGLAGHGAHAGTHVGSDDPAARPAAARAGIGR